MPGWTYAEKREQPKPDRQQRTLCHNCHREWLYATYYLTPDWQKDGRCPTCGSLEIEVITVEGIYDSTTDPNEIALKMMGVSPEQLVQEQQARQAAAMTVREVDPPPAVLTGMKRSFAPEFD